MQKTKYFFLNGQPTLDELREVSVLYGSKGKLKNLFPTGYGHKKHKHANEGENI